jgi:hypothetical protein
MPRQFYSGRVLRRILPVLRGFSRNVKQAKSESGSGMGENGVAFE